MTEMQEVTIVAAPATGRIARSTLIVMGGFALSMVVGLIKQRIFSVTFGTASAYDAFVAANAIPELLVNMLASGALAFAFIPIYTDTLQSDDPYESDHLFSNVFNVLLLLASLASLIGAILAPTLIRAPWGVAPHFPPEKQFLTIQLMRILLVTTVIFALSSMLTGLLQARAQFVFPALGPALYTSGLIFGASVLAPKLGIFGLAWGAIIGALLHFLVHLPGLLIKKIRWYPLVDFASMRLRRVAVLMAPRIIDLMMAQVTLQWLNTNLASRMGEGRVAAIQYAYTLMNMPWNFIGVAIGTVVFPTMAVLATHSDLGAQRKALSDSLRAVLALAIPAAAGLVLLGRPIIQILYEGGEFTPQDTELVYFALQFFALLLISQSMLNVVVPAYAAQKDTLTPLLVSIFTTAVNIGLAIMLSRPVGHGGLAHGGLPLARALSIGLEVALDLAILHIRWGGVNGRRILLDSGKALIATGAMSAGVLAIGFLLHPHALMMLVLGGGVGAALYFGVALAIGIREVRSVPEALFRSLLRRPIAESVPS